MQKKNIWLIMGGMMVITTLLTLIVQNTVLILIIQRYVISTPQPFMAFPTPVPQVLAPTLATAITPSALSALTPPPSTHWPTFTPALMPEPSTPLPSTLTPTPAPTFTPTPEISTLSPDIARQQLAPIDQQAQKLDEKIPHVIPEELKQSECPYIISVVPSECWIYRIGIENMVVLKGYTGLADLYVYDFDSDGRPEMLKWDLARDNQIDVFEYDIDKDGKLDYALADMNGNGYFENDEIYMQAGGRWQSLVPGVLPFPVLPLFPY